MAGFILVAAGDWQSWENLPVMTQVFWLLAVVLGSLLVYVGLLLAAGLRWRHIYR